jgi:hypothetical protein
MLLHEGQMLLLGILTLEQFPDGAEPIRPVGSSKGTGLFQRRARVPFGQTQESLHHADAFDAADRKHSLGPATRLGAQAANLGQQPGGATLDGADLLRGQVLPLRAEATRCVFDVQGDLLEPVIKRRFPQTLIPPQS